MKITFAHIIYIFLIIGAFLACSSNRQFVAESELAPIISSYEINKFTPTKQTNSNLNFYNYLSGINSVIVVTSEELESVLDNDNEFYRKYHKLMRDYISGLGLKNIAITAEEQNWIQNNIPLEKITYLHLDLGNSKNYISNISMVFKSCNGDEFIFSKSADYYAGNDWDQYFFNIMKEMFWCNVIHIPKNTLRIKKDLTKWDKEAVLDYFSNNDIDEMEGIYEKYGSGNIDYDSKYCIALINENNDYKIIYLGGAINEKNWCEGEVKGRISKTSIKDFYKVQWVMSDKSYNENVYLTTSNYNFLEFDFLESNLGFKTKYLKIFPYGTENANSSDDYISSGTGFLISEEGYLVTNHHIIKNSRNIKIQFKCDSTVNEYDAEIIFDDSKNDLTILRAKNIDMQLKNGVPFKISNTEAPIGTSVFTLGYPMIETMGESVKLADGIISSNSGYMSDKKLYQVTVPINPGNSGGPLFDKNGDLVGIINAKYTGAENVAYAIKSNTLLYLIEGSEVYKSTANSLNLKDLNLADQVKVLDELICLIKVYN